MVNLSIGKLMGLKMVEEKALIMKIDMLLEQKLKMVFECVKCCVVSGEKKKIENERKTTVSEREENKNKI